MEKLGQQEIQNRWIASSCTLKFRTNSEVFIEIILEIHQDEFSVYLGPVIPDSRGLTIHSEG